MPTHHRSLDLQNDHSVDTAYVEFRLHAPSIGPSEVTKRLGVEPDDVVVQGPNEIRPGIWRELPMNGWFLSSDGKVHDKDVRPHLDWLLDRLEKGKDALAEILAMDGTEAWVTAHWWSTGGGTPVLRPSQMRRLADLDLELWFSFAEYGSKPQATS